MQILEDTLRAIYNGALEADDFTPKGLFIYKHNKTFKTIFSSDLNLKSHLFHRNVAVLPEENLSAALRSRDK